MKPIYKFLVTLISYFIFGKLALFLSIPPGFATPVWPAAGAALACVLIFGHGVLPAICLGSILVNLSTSLNFIAESNAIILACSIGLGASLQALLGAYLIRRFIGYPCTLTKPKEILLFFFLSGPIPSILSAAWGSFSLLIFNVVSFSILTPTFFTWWAGDTIGVVLIAPLFVILAVEHGKKNLRRRLSIVLPVSLVLFATTAYFVFIRSSEKKQTETEFFYTCKNDFNLLAQEINIAIEILYSVKNFYHSSNFVDRDEFKIFVQNHLKRSSALNALSWNPRVLNREQFEQEVQKQGFKNFRITTYDKNYNLLNAEKKEEYFPVNYIEPFEENQSIIGLDMSSIKERQLAIENAIMYNKDYASERLILIKKTPHLPGLLVFLPIYNDGLNHQKLKNSRSNLKGILSGFFVIDELFSDLKIFADIHFFQFKVLDANKNLVFSYPENQSNPKNFIWQTTINISGQKWKIIVWPSSKYFEKNKSVQSYFVLLAGFLFCSLLTSFLLILTGYSSYVDQIVNEQTQKLQESQQRFQLAVQGSNDGIWDWDIKKDKVYFSPQWKNMIGYKEDEIENKFETWKNLLHPQDVSKTLQTIEDYFSGKTESYEAEFRMLHKDGSWRWVVSRGILLRDENDAPSRMAGSHTDVTKRKKLEETLKQKTTDLEQQKAEALNLAQDADNARKKAEIAEAEISASLKIKEALIKEVHHRVKNNMQVISSLFNIQTRFVRDPKDLEIFKDSQNRVKSMAMIHEKLYRSNDLSRVNFKEYAENLSQDLLLTYQYEIKQIELIVDVNVESLDADRTIPLGLILNELVSNILKYAFKNITIKPQIKIELAHHQDIFLIFSVCDNGCGMPIDYEAKKKQSLGLQIIDSLSKQLRGKKQFISEPGKGTRFELIFPLESNC